MSKYFFNYFFKMLIQWFLSSFAEKIRRIDNLIAEFLKFSYLNFFEYSIINKKLIKSMNEKYIKSPLNYNGGKYKILPQLMPLFPQGIDTFVDLFTGGCNVGINAKSKRLICNDNIDYLIDLYQFFSYCGTDELETLIYKRIDEYGLSLTNVDGYNKLRDEYNKNRRPLDLFILLSYSFNHQIRFNNSHDFNSSFGKNRSCFNESIRQNLIAFVNKIHVRCYLTFTCKDFGDFDYDMLFDGGNNFVYMDPPYLITTASYNDGRRGFTGWNDEQEKRLYDTMTMLTKKGVKFAMSNVFENKGKKNTSLIDFVKDNNYNVRHIINDYHNANYHALNKEKNTSDEVLITNYPLPDDSLF